MEVEEEESGVKKKNNELAQYAAEEHLRLIIDRLSISPYMLGVSTLRNHYVAVRFRPLKTHPVVKETVRCFFLDGKCRRHKCLFDLMTRCPIRAQAGTHTRPSTFYLPRDPSEFPLALPSTGRF